MGIPCVRLGHDKASAVFGSLKEVVADIEEVRPSEEDKQIGVLKEFRCVVDREAWRVVIHSEQNTPDEPYYLLFYPLPSGFRDLLKGMNGHKTLLQALADAGVIDCPEMGAIR